MTTSDTPAPKAIIFPSQTAETTILRFGKKDYPFETRESARHAAEHIKFYGQNIYLGAPAAKNVYGSPTNLDGDLIPGAEYVA